MQRTLAPLGPLIGDVGRKMKNPRLYEGVGMGLAILGALLLVAALAPLINPELVRIKMHGRELPAEWYYLTTPISILVLAAAWYFNRKAHRLGRQDGNRPTSR